MQRRKLFSIAAVSLVILIAAMGFYSDGSDHNKNTSATITFDPNAVNSKFTGSNNVDNVNAGAWTSGAVMPTAVYLAGASSYVRGDTGWIYTCGQVTALTTVYRYNITTNTWTTMAPMPIGLDRNASVTLKDSIFEVGGANASSVYQTTVQKYDIGTNTWVARNPLPAGVGWNKLVAYQDSLIYCAGGYNGTSVVNTVYLYNALTGTWRTATPLPLARFGGGFARSGDTLVYLFGIDAAGASIVNTVYKGVISQTNRATITWTTSAATPPAPFTAGVFRTDAASWGCKGVIITNGDPTTSFIGTNGAATYSPGADAWTSLPNKTNITTAAEIASVSLSGNRWKLVCAGGVSNGALVTVNDIFTDTLCLPPPIALCEQFATATFPPTGWSMFVYTAPNDWLYSTASGFAIGTGCAMFDCWNGATGSRAGMITPTLITSNAVTFDTLYIDDAMYPLGTGDSLVIVGSTDNGTTWNTTTPIAAWNATQLGSTTATHPFVPTTAAQWKKSKIILPGNINRLQFIGRSNFGDSYYIDSLCIFHTPVGIGTHGNVVPVFYSLNQNYPNPFNPSTQISFGLPKSGNVKLVVYDILGREVKTLVNEFQTAGTHNITFDASSLASGIYFYSITANDFTATKKMLLVK